MAEDGLKSLRGKLLSGRVYPEFFPFDPNDHVINLGCGEGPQAIVYAGHFKEMVGVDINSAKLEKAKEATQIYGVQHFTTLRANVECVPLPDSSFDKAVAVDVIEHVQNPSQLCLEVRRLLKENGELLVTFPAMHDRFTHLVSRVGRFVLRRKRERLPSTEWDPSAHNHYYPLKEWIAIVEGCGFKLYKSRASTLFPPLHLYGIPRFWFGNNIIHRMDAFLCRMPIVKNYGQALVCIFSKGKVHQ